ncbi:MAG TPA: hypothetical protein VGK17_03130 [Propionicimonas sp.]
MPSTLTGYVPKVGDHVWQQMYSPQQPHWSSTIEERVAGGITYGPRRRMIVVYASVDHLDDHGNPVLHWQLLPADPKDRHGEFPWSIVDSDWCVLEIDDEAEWQESLL